VASPKPLYQQIKERYQLYPAYHMTHVDNLLSILKAGKILSYNGAAAVTKTSIANDDVQAGRARITIPATGMALHDYVPLYFGFKTPMVAYNHEKNEQLIFLRFSLDIFRNIPGIVVSDGNARSGSTRFVAYKSIDDLGALDVKAIHTVKYAHDGELKRKKQAELLVPDELPIGHLFDIICFSQDAQNTVVAALKQHGITVAVQINPGWYFLPR
jgi:hypothetical protein